MNVSKSPCPHHPRCPGCPLLVQTYQDQLASKRKIVFGDLKGFWQKSWGNLDALLQPVIASPRTEGYRTVGKFALTRDKDGRHQWGIFEEGTQDLVATPGCLVILPEMKALLNKMGAVVAKFKRGRVKFVSLRFCLHTGGVGIVLSHDGVTKEDLLSWIREWNSDSNGAQVSIFESKLGPKDGKRIIGAASKHLTGPAFMTWKALGYVFHVTPLAFFQANGFLSEALANTVAEWQEDKGKASRSLIDLYGGFGAYSLPLVKKFEQVYLVDANRECIAAARDAKGRFHVSNLTAAATTGEDFLKNRLTTEKRQEITHLIVNPPRDGLSEKLIEHLKAADLTELRSLTYVSCHSGTLARDLGRLADVFQFTVDRISAFDMFPQTRHIETVVRLTIKPAEFKEVRH